MEEGRSTLNRRCTVCQEVYTVRSEKTVSIASAIASVEGKRQLMIVIAATLIFVGILRMMMPLLMSGVAYDHGLVLFACVLMMALFFSLLEDIRRFFSLGTTITVGR